MASNKQLYKADLPYPKIRVEQPNREYAKLILEDYAGFISEMSAVNLYMYDHLVTAKQYKEIADALEEVAVVEMVHQQILGEILIELGVQPKYWSERRRRKKYWNADYIPYQLDAKIILLDAIQSEKDAIIQYNRHLRMIQDQYIQRVIDRILLDEELHLELFNSLYNEYFEY